MRLLELKPRHAITRLALSPDGSRVAVGQLGRGVRVIETLTGTDASPLVEHTSRTDFLRLNSPTGRHALTVGRQDVLFAETALGAPVSRFQPGWRRGWNRNHPPDEPTEMPLDLPDTGASVVVTAYGSTRHPVPWFQLAPCALSGDHRYVVGRSAYHEERIVLYDLACEAIVGRFPNARGLGMPFHATFPTAGQLALADMRGISLYDLTAALAEPPAIEEAAPVVVTEPERGPIGRFVRTLFRTGPRAQKPHKAAAQAPHPIPLLEPWATVIPTAPQPDTEIPPFAQLPCGRRMIVRGEKSRIELRDLATGDVTTVWKWGLRRVRALAVSADGLMAAAAGDKGQLMLWDLE